MIGHTQRGHKVLAAVRSAEAVLNKNCLPFLKKILSLGIFLRISIKGRQITGNHHSTGKGFLMKAKHIILFLSLFIVAGGSSPCHAAVEWDIQNKLQTDARILDVAVSANDKWLFVLNDRGEVLIYSKDGTLKDKIEVGKQIDQVKVGPREDVLYLTSRSNKTVETIRLDFIQSIDTVGSPYKGPIDAPVVIAVFSDFQ